MVSGCLIPQDDQVIPELPPLKNRPPRIVAARYGNERADEVELRTGTACSREEFNVLVDDLDLDDTLRSFWFIDKTETSLPLSPSPLGGSGQVTRTLSQPSGIRTQLGNLSAGPHRLTVYVVDSDIQEIQNAQIRPVEREVLLPDGKTGRNDGYVDEFTWFINAVSCAP